MTTAPNQGQFGPNQFNVQTVGEIQGNLSGTVAAKLLQDSSGDYVIDPSTSRPYVVPADYNPASIISYYQQSAASYLSQAATSGIEDPFLTERLDLYGQFLSEFRTNGISDLQTAYDGSTGQSFVPAFTAAASFNLGLAGAAAGVTATEDAIGGGLYNLLKSTSSQDPINTGSILTFFNNPANPPRIYDGNSDYYTGMFAPTNVTDDDINITGGESGNSEQYAISYGAYSSADNTSVSGNDIPLNNEVDTYSGALVGQTALSLDTTGDITDEDINYNDVTVVGVSGAATAIVGNNDLLTLQQNAVSGNLYGEYDDVYGDPGGVIGLTGGNDTAVANSSTIYINSGSTNANVDGNSDTVSSDSGNLIGITGSGDSAYASGNTIYLNSGDQNANVYGNNDTVSSAAGNLIGITGTGDTTFTSNDTVYLNSGDQNANVDGNNDTVSSAAGNLIGITGTGDTTFTSNDTVYLNSGDTNANVDGSNNTINVASNDTFGISGGGDTANVSSATAYINANSNATIDGSNDTIDLGDKNNNSVTLGPDYYDTIFASNATINGSSYDTFYVHGDHDTINDSNASIIDYGDDNVVVGSNDGFENYGTNDTYSGSGDTGSNDGDTYYSSSDFGMATGVTNRLNIVSQYDDSHGLTSAATNANSAWARAQQAIGSSSATSADSTPFEGPVWSTSSPITWSFADGTGTAAAPFSGQIQSQYEAAIIAAMQTWSQASGLTFQEVPDSPSSDIRLGWGSFDTSDSGVAGYTTHTDLGNQIQPGSIVRLEDPTDDTLTAASDGSLTYGGTDTSFSQLILHEIGHALGLGVSSDPTSIMFPELGASNRTLDANDIGLIQMLYDQPGPGSGTSGAFSEVAVTSSAVPIGLSTLAPSPAVTMTPETTTSQGIIGTH